MQLPGDLGLNHSASCSSHAPRRLEEKLQCSSHHHRTPLAPTIGQGYHHRRRRPSTSCKNYKQIDILFYGQNCQKIAKIRKIFINCTMTNQSLQTKKQTQFANLHYYISQWHTRLWTSFYAKLCKFLLQFIQSISISTQIQVNVSTPQWLNLRQQVLLFEFNRSAT